MVDSKVLAFVEEKHKGQFRKFTGIPYTSHVHGVANLLETFAETVTEADLDVALCHDVLEDTKTSIKQLADVIGMASALRVHMLSNWFPKTLAYDQRTTLYNEQLRLAPDADKRIKCSDIIHNTSDLLLHRKDISYLVEKRNTLYHSLRNPSFIFSVATVQVDLMLNVAGYGFSFTQPEDRSRLFAVGLQMCVKYKNLYTISHVLNAVTKYMQELDDLSIVTIIRTSAQVKDDLDAVWLDCYKAAVLEMEGRGRGPSTWIGLPKLEAENAIS